MKISVIIPCYNASKTIKNTLKSLEEQEYKDFEVIVIDDGSRDKLEEAVHQYQKKSALNIRYYKQKNAGVSAARNTGIQKASGDYITFLDADDSYTGDYLKKLYTSLIHFKADIAFCRWARRIEDKKNDVKYKSYSPEKAMEIYMYKTWRVLFCCCLYKKALIDKYHIRFPILVSYGEDNEFFWKYICHCNRTVMIDKAMYYYYENKKSAMHMVSWKMVQAISSVENIEKYIKEWNYSFYEKFSVYMNARIRMSIAKNFAIAGNAELYERFYKSYDVKKYMQSLFQDQHFLIRITSKFLYLNKDMFFRIMSILGKIKDRKG